MGSSDNFSERHCHIPELQLYFAIVETFLGLHWLTLPICKIVQKGNTDIREKVWNDQKDNF